MESDVARGIMFMNLVLVRVVSRVGLSTTYWGMNAALR